jgi:hypothetical protein
VACDVELQETAAGALELTPVEADCLYRVAQEALQNVEKHAAARTVKVQLTAELPGLYELEIADDGIGLPADALDKPASLGLLGMEERTRELGGSLEVANTEGGGTRVQPALYAENTFKAGPVTLLSGVRASAMVLREHASFAVDPRASVTFASDSRTSFTATLGRYSQFPLSREVLPSSRGEVDLAPSWSLQASGTLRRELAAGLSAELTAWWSELYDLVSGRGDRFEFTAGPPVPLPADALS